MPDLLLAADAAYPPSYPNLPSAVKVVLGYVGGPGCTPNIWTHTEAATARRQVGTWWPIWTLPEHAVSAQYGQEAANACSKVLPGYHHPADAPVFLDVEHATIAANVHGARACIAAWVDGMSQRGYPNAHVYASGNVGGDWQPRWGEDRPDDLPPGLVGVQYAANLDGGRYDLDVFDASLLTDPPKHETDPPHPFPTQHTYVVKRGDTLSSIAHRFDTTWRALYRVNRDVIGSDPDLIRVGIRLVIPGHRSARHYVVKRGDTLAGTARRFDTTWQTLYALNRQAIGSDPDLIRPGLRLLLP